MYGARRWLGDSDDPPAEATLAGARGDEEVLLASGVRLAVGPGPATGFVDRVAVEDGRVAISAWAVDRGGGQPAGCILVFVDGELAVSGLPNVPRPDVEKLHGSGTGLSGYQLSVPVPKAGEVVASPTRVRVLAVAGGRATELEPSR